MKNNNINQLENERWLPVKTWETVYEVSNFGRIRRITNGIRNIGRAGHIMGFTPDKDGYLQVKLSHGKHRKIRKVHRLVVEAFIGDIPPKHVTNHLDGNPANNHLSNLEITTYSGNNLHAFRVLGRKPVCIKGEANRAKLSNEQVLKIRERYANEGGRNKLNYAHLAIEYNVHPDTIARIVRREGWKHI